MEIRYFSVRSKNSFIYFMLWTWLVGYQQKVGEPIPMADVALGGQGPLGRDENAEARRHPGDIELKKALHPPLVREVAIMGWVGWGAGSPDPLSPPLRPVAAADLIPRLLPGVVEERH